VGEAVTWREFGTFLYGCAVIILDPIRRWFR
jgi:hypothetical protein